MKYLAWIGGLILTLLVGVYVIAFTSFGNSLLQPTLEEKIAQGTNLNSKLTKFSLTMSDFSVVLELDRENIIYVNGNYSLFSQSFDVAYRVRLDKLESLKPLTNAPLVGSLGTDGTVKGDMAFIEIKGSSDVASSQTSYNIELTELNPTSIIAKIQKADLKSLLLLGGQAPYANGDLNLDINFRDIRAHKLDGDILLQTLNADIDTALMRKDFNITLPKTSFAMNLNAELKGDDVDYRYTLDSNLAKISSDGKVTPQPLKTDIKYSVDIQELAVLKPITNAPLRGAFKTSGTIKGTKQSMLIDGVSDVGASDTTYKIDLKEFAPLSVIASIKGAKLQKLLYMVGQPNFAKSDLDVDVKLTSLDPKNLAGFLDINLKNGLVNSKVMKKSYKVNIPRTTFNSNTHVDLKGKSVDYTTAFNSNLAKLNSSGNLEPDSMKMDLKYSVDVKELAVLKPITGADIRGAFKLNGKVKGDKDKLVVDGKSDFASSDTSFIATLNDFAPRTVKASMKNLKLAKVLYMVKQPHYADGVFSLDVDISDAREGKLKGTVNSFIKKGLVDSKYMTKAYKFNTKMPKTTFDMQTQSVLNVNIVDTKLDFNSNLASFDVKQARFNIADSSIVSDYIVKVANLDKLYFATDRHMKGGVSADGELKKAKNLDLTIHSKVVGGVIDAKLHNDDFHADLKSLQTLDILDMLLYPKILKSSLNGVLDYNLAKQKGVMNGDLVDGKFTTNQVLDLAKQYAHKDLYKETFKGKVNAKINRENIVASLNLNSNKSSIVTKDTKLNSKTQRINSKVDINANNNKFSIKLKGDVNSPKVSIDAKKIIEKEAQKKLNKFLEDEKTQDAVNKLFKKLF